MNLKINYIDNLMAKKLIIFISIIITLGIISCAHNIAIDELSSSQRLKVAEELMSQGKYREARPIYERIVFESKGDTLVKRAQYQLANCYYYQKVYEDAIIEYEQLLRRFPTSEYAEDATFMIGTCWYELSLPYHYDQTETLRAIEQLEYFISQYPNSPKLAEAEQILFDCQTKLLAKKYENARIYYILGYNNAALMYLEEIISENINGEIDKKALILAAKIYYKRGNKEALLKVQERFQQKYPQDRYNEILENLLADLQ
ncbi:MAG: outer membrane protein assembly factor BamD [Candidatus Cloacimonadia bacterium]